MQRAARILTALALVVLAPLDAMARWTALRSENFLFVVRELIAIDHRSPIYNEGLRRGVLYAESWALVHYVMFGNKARAAQLPGFLAAIKSGAPSDQAFREAFGDVNVLDRELKEYVRLFTFPALQLTFGEKVGGGGAQRGEVIPDALAAAYLGDVLARLGRTDDARTHLRSVLEKNPDVARALIGQGEKTRATPQLGPLMARGSRPEIRDSARQLIGAMVTPDQATAVATFRSAAPFRTGRGRPSGGDRDRGR